jgi:hypothetical protein
VRVADRASATRSNQRLEVGEHRRLNDHALTRLREALHSRRPLNSSSINRREAEIVVDSLDTLLQEDLSVGVVMPFSRFVRVLTKDHWPEGLLLGSGAVIG